MVSDSFMNAPHKSTSNSVSQMTPAEVKELREDFKEAMKLARLIISGKEFMHRPK